MNLPLALGTLVAVALVNLIGVESQAKTCYFGPPPQPLPGEHWTKAAAREIRKRCPGKQTTTADTRPADCQALLDAGTNVSGVYTIYPSQYPDGLQVYCDMMTDSSSYFNGSWIVFQRRQDGSVNFTRSWAEYRDGFGNLTGEFWLGNEKLRQLTAEGHWELLVGLTSETDPLKFATLYKSFRITSNNYTLSIATVHSYIADNAVFSGDSLSAYNDQSFSTYDRDNDGEDDINCADQCKGGWWFDRCRLGWGDVRSNLNGEYSDAYDWYDTGRGIWWDTVYKGQIVQCEMKIRRTSSN